MDKLKEQLAEQIGRLSTRLDEMEGRKERRDVNSNTVRIEGAGSIWNGLAVGIALGAVIAGGAWIVSTQQRLESIAQQSEAYSKAVYMLAPRFSEEIDKELSKKKEE